MILISNLTLLRQYLAVNQDIGYEEAEPFLKKADRSFILNPVWGIGKELYDSLMAAESPNDLQVDLLDLLRTATGAAAHAGWVRIHSVNHGAGGVTVTRTEGEAPASDQKIESIIAELLNTANEFLDLALELLESNPTEAAFAVWRSSPAYTLRKSSFIASTFEFEKYYPIYQSRKKYLMLRPFILQGEQELIAPELGEEFYNVLKAEYQSKVVSEMTFAYILPMQYIQRCLANYAVAKMLTQKAGDPKAIADARSVSDQNLKLLISHLKKNAADFPGYATESATYQGSIANSKESRKSQFFLG